jgi:flagellar motor switch protein FliG
MSEIAIAEAPVTEPLTGVRKAAMLLILLGDKVSAEMVKQLHDDEVQLVAREIARLESISSEDSEVLLEEFYQMTKAHDLAARGGMDYASKILMTAFGSHGGKKMVERLSKAMGADFANLDLLQKADPQQLAKFIHNEHPQTIALVLSHLDAAQAASLLLSLPPEMRSDIALRMANLDQISPDVVNKIAAVIAQKLQAIAEYSRESYGGIRAVSEMFNRLDAGNSKEILAVIDRHNPNLVETIRQLMFVFEDLLLIDITQLRIVLARVDRRSLTLALKGTSEPLKEHFFSTMSARAMEMMKEDIDSLGPVRIKEVESAQRQIIATVRQLEVEGLITLKETAGDQYVV